MSRKIYIAMAKEFSTIPKMDVRQIAAIAFAKVALNDNPRFDTDKFLSACGVI